MNHLWSSIGHCLRRITLQHLLHWYNCTKDFYFPRKIDIKVRFYSCNIKNYKILLILQKLTLSHKDNVWFALVALWFSKHSLDWHNRSQSLQRRASPGIQSFWVTCGACWGTAVLFYVLIWFITSITIKMCSIKLVHRFDDIKMAIVKPMINSSFSLWAFIGYIKNHFRFLILKNHAIIII